MKKLIKLSKFIFVFCLFLIITSGRIESSDGISALNVTRNIVSSGSFNIAPPSYGTGIQSIKGANGNYYSPTSLGSSLIYLPAALVTKGVYDLNNFTQGEFFPLQMDYLLTFLASFINPIFGFILFIVNYKIFKLFTKKENTSFFLSLAISFATNLLPLSKHSFFHVPFIFFLMSSFYFVLRRKLFASSIFFGLGVLTYNIIFLPILIVYALFIHLYSSKKAWITWLGGITPFILTVFWFNFVRFSNPFVAGYDFGTFDLKVRGVFFEGLWGLLLSPGKSIFVYSPILLIAVYLAVKNLKKDIFSKLFIVLTVLLIVIYANFVFWSGDLSWGPRYLSVIIPYAGVVLAKYWDKLHKPLFYFLIAVGLFVQLEGITIPYEYQYPIYNLSAFKKVENLDRRAMFEYWSIGQFIPRYSPIYTLKKDVLKRLINTPSIFPERSNVIFAQGASRPYKSDSGYYKIGRSILYFYSKEDMKFRNISFIARNMKGNKFITGAKICLNNGCFNSNKLGRTSDEYKIDFPVNLKIKKNDYAILKLFPNDLKTEDFEYQLYSFSFGKNSINLSDFKVGIQDHFFAKGTPFDYKGKELYRYYDQKFKLDEAINTTPDFWWTHPFIFYNLPFYFKAGFYTLLLIALVSGGGVIWELTVLKKGGRKQN